MSWIQHHEQSARCENVNFGDKKNQRLLPPCNTHEVRVTLDTTLFIAGAEIFFGRRFSLLLMEHQHHNLALHPTNYNLGIAFVILTPRGEHFPVICWCIKVTK